MWMDVQEHIQPLSYKAEFRIAFPRRSKRNQTGANIKLLKNNLNKKSLILSTSSP